MMSLRDIEKYLPNSKRTENKQQIIVEGKEVNKAPYHIVREIEKDNRIIVVGKYRTCAERDEIEKKQAVKKEIKQLEKKIAQLKRS